MLLSEAESDWLDIIKGVRDWITASETALAMPWIMVALGVTTDADVAVSGGAGRVAGAADATGAVCLRRTLGTSGPELHTTFLDRDGRGIVLRGKIKTKQNMQQAKKDLNRSKLLKVA